jgi:hypothetical protein
MKPTFNFSPAAKGLAAAANLEVARNELSAAASSNPLRNISGEPPWSSAVDGVVAVVVVGPEVSVLELAGTAVGWAGTAVGSSLPQAAKATMAMSMNTPISIRWECVNMGSFRIRLYKLLPPEFLGTIW